MASASLLVGAANRSDFLKTRRNRRAEDNATKLVYTIVKSVNRDLRDGTGCDYIEKGVYRLVFCTIFFC